MWRFASYQFLMVRFSYKFICAKMQWILFVQIYHVDNRWVWIILVSVYEDMWYM